MGQQHHDLKQKNHGGGSQPREWISYEGAVKTDRTKWWIEKEKNQKQALLIACDSTVGQREGERDYTADLIHTWIWWGYISARK